MSDLTKSFTITASPQQAFDAIVDPRSWWDGAIVGPTESVGDEWVYLVNDMHFSKFRVDECLPGERVSWRVTDSILSYLSDTSEWSDTLVTFELADVAEGTRVTFTHVGLTPQVECFEACDGAWGHYILSSLRERIGAAVSA